MTPYEAYVLYCALKMHFTTEDYDFIKYNGKFKTSVDNFERRRDKFFFAKLAKRKDIKEYLISSFVSSNSTWIGDLVNNSSIEEHFIDWKKRTQALSYFYEEELKKLLTNLDENVIVKEHQHPFLLKLVLRKKVSIETLVILNDLLNFFPHWNKQLESDILWKDVHLLCRKYRSFLQYDKKAMKAITLKVFSDNAFCAT